MAAIKGPGPRSPDVGPKGAQQGPPLGALETALLRSGIAKTPTQARVLARSLVAALTQAGFPPSPEGGAAEQLRSFQRAYGLPVTGKLDDATRAKLSELGILPTDAGAAKPTELDAKPAQPKLGGAPTAKSGWGTGAQEYFGPKGPSSARGSTTTAAPGERSHVVAHEQARARAEHMKDHASRDLSNFLESLATLGFFGGGKGKQRLEGALRSLQHAAKLPVTGKLDAATVRELIQRGALPEGTQVPRQQEVTTRPGASSPSTQAPTSAPHPSRASRDAASLRDNAAASSPQGQQGAGQTGAQGGAASAGADGSGRVVSGDPGGEVDDDNNAPAGDEDRRDERRGHATLDDEEQRDEGYYDVPKLSVQVREALDAIARNDDESGAATYSWDVTIYRPGVYGRRQPAEPLWHVVVDRAGAFDPVWQKAKQALEERMREIEPEGAPPSDDDFRMALRRARVR